VVIKSLEKSNFFVMVSSTDLILNKGGFIVMEKIIVTAAFVTGLVFSSNQTWAFTKAEAVSTTKANALDEKQEEYTNFMKFSGVISDIKSEAKKIIITVENQESSIMIFPITEEVLLYSGTNGENLGNDKLEKGSKVEVYYAKNKPMPLIYPATIIPDFIVVNGEGLGAVKVAKFNQTLISLDNDLKLHISKDTALLDQNGQKLKEADLYGKELIVFYTTSTRSIPAQTTPTKIIALNQKEDIILGVNEIIAVDHFIKNGTKMIPIRKVAEYLGYTVDWKGRTKGANVRKQNLSIQLQIGKKDYGYNRSLRYFTESPIIQNNKTYVSEDILEILLQD
jgi:hypothetical protein